MMIQKDKIKNVVLSVDRGFRTQVGRLFGDAGFPGEKVFVANVSEAASILKFDRQALNICVSPDNLPTPEYLEILAGINNGIAGTSVLALVYMRLDQARDMNEVKSALPYLNLRLLPLKRSDFIAVFRSMRGISLEGFRPPEIHKDEKNSSKDSGKRSSRGTSVVSFFEATQHLRESIESMNDLIKDPSRLDLLQAVGQRFNGLVGAYCFLQNQSGFKELFHLSVVVDDISRNYRPHSEMSSVGNEHLDLLVKAVKCAFLILKNLRDGAEPLPSQSEEAIAIFDAFRNDATIVKRDLITQDDVELLLTKFANG